MSDAHSQRATKRAIPSIHERNYPPKPCRACGEPFQPATPGHLYCDKCKQRTCKTCGKPISPQQILRRIGTQFCSLSCHAKWRSQYNAGPRHPSYVEYPATFCKQCGAQLSHDQLKERQQFCSVACYHAYRQTTSICKACGTEFKHGKGLNRSYCSRSCYRSGNTFTCKVCGKEFYRRPSRIRRGSIHVCSHECAVQWYTGERASYWRGGWQPYYGPNWRRQAQACRKRDMRCQRCGKTTRQNGKRLSVHHIIPFREFGYIHGQNNNYKIANDLNNLVTLCADCHLAVENGAPLQLRLLSV